MSPRTYDKDDGERRHGRLRLGAEKGPFRPDAGVPSLSVARVRVPRLFGSSLAHPPSIHALAGTMPGMCLWPFCDLRISSTKWNGSFAVSRNVQRESREVLNNDAESVRVAT